MTSHSDDAGGPAIVDGVAVSWDEARAANLANWEDRVPLHLEAYAIDALRQDPGHISSVVRDDLPLLLKTIGARDLSGLTLCHLQCHIGTDTVSLARAGARVTGVDFSPSALEAAACLARELGIDATWVLTDVLDAHAAVTKAQGTDVAFDVVYTSIGTIGWLSDIEVWAQQVSSLLKQGGVFYIRDGHPALYSLDDAQFPPVPAYRYFADGKAMQIDEAGTYAGDGILEHQRTFEYPHPISDVVNALIGHGLEILRLDEGRTLPWQFSEAMIDTGDGNYVFPAPYDAVVPCTFTVVARKR